MLKADANGAQRTLGQVAYDALREMILSGEIRPGERLAERELARRVQVSRTPLREALGWLARDGLAVSKPGMGYFALEFDRQIIAEMYEYRAALEIHVCRVAAERISEAGLSELDAIMRRLAVFENTETMSLEQLREEVHLGLQIHEVIARESGNRLICDALLQIYDRLRLLIWIDVLCFDKWSLTRNEHRELVAAIKARDGERAAAMARQHIERCGDDGLWVIGAQSADQRPPAAAPRKRAAARR